MAHTERRAWYRPRLLWLVPDGAIIGEASGQLTLVDVETFQTLRAALLEYRPPVTVTDADVIMLEGAPDVEYALRQWQVGSYMCRAVYVAAGDIWYIRGEPERLPPTNRDFIEGKV